MLGVPASARSVCARSVCAFTVCAVLASGPAQAQSSTPGSGLSALRQPMLASRTHSLERCLDLAIQNYPKIREARARHKKQTHRLWEVQTTPYSQFSLRAGLAGVPSVNGTSVYSPNSDGALSSEMALAWQVGLQGVVPLWTFGKIDSAIDAARAHTAVGEHQVEKAKNELRLSVREAFYGAQLSRDARLLIEQATTRIDKYIVRMQIAVDDDDGDEIELLKLKMHRAELNARHSEATKNRRIAMSALQFLIGSKGRLEIDDVPLEELGHSLGPLSRYMTAARFHRPEINMAKAGVQVRRALVQFERSRYFPDVGVGLSFAYSRAPGRADQVNPYVNDVANFLSYGAGLVLNWKMDLLPQAARVAQARAQLEEVRATEAYALGGVAVEVEKAFAEAVDAEQRLSAYREATGYAKRWLISVQQGIDIGTYDDEDVVDPAKEFALKRFSLMQATFDFNMALARLALATGWDDVASG